MRRVATTARQLVPAWEQTTASVGGRRQVLGLCRGVSLWGSLANGTVCGTSAAVPGGVVLRPLQASERIYSWSGFDLALGPTGCVEL